MDDKIKINKNIIIVFLLLSVFAVGTLTFTETVDAAKWKKFDTGKFPIKDTKDYIPGAKPFMKYVSYSKPNNIQINMYITKKSDNKNIKFMYMQFTKPNKNYVKMTSKSVFETKKDSETMKWPYSLKSYYKIVIYGLKKEGI